jgi:serine/threonine protein phosphatase PrpC
MKLVWKAFSLCKEGNREEENEDAVYPQLVNGSSLVADQFSCAMADGATTSSFSKLWANLLVKESSLSHTVSYTHLTLPTN